MASSRMIIKVAIVMFMCMVVAAPKPAEAAPGITCNQVVNSLTPCVGYVVGGGTVPANCCNGIRSIWNAARTTPDRQMVCTCLKQAVSGIALPSYSLALAAALPSRCGVNVPYQISPSTNCQSVK